MARILITGANGQVGAALVKYLSGKVTLFTFDHRQLDITDRRAVFATLHRIRPDLVINAAAYTAVDQAEIEPVLADAVNHLGVMYLAQACAEVGSAVIHLSTDYVFDGVSRAPYLESARTQPQTVYGKSKQAGEFALKNANPRSVIVRTSWVFGGHGSNFVKTVLRLAKQQESLRVVADQFGAPTYVGDIVKALAEIAQQILRGNARIFGTYHFSGLPYVSRYQFAEEIIEQAYLQNLIEKRPLVSAIESSEYPTLAKRPRYACLDLTKIRRTFMIKPCDWRCALTDLRAYMME